MIYYLEDDLTGSQIYASNTENADLVEVSNADEAITSVYKARNYM